MISGKKKDPERVRLGRLGALIVHSRGRTNTAPATAAWRARLAAEVDPHGTLSLVERERRLQYAIRARMTRVAMARWSKKAAAGSLVTTPAAASAVRSTDDHAD